MIKGLAQLYRTLEISVHSFTWGALLKEKYYRLQELTHFTSLIKNKTTILVHLLLLPFVVLLQYAVYRLLVPVLLYIVKCPIHMQTSCCFSLVCF